MSKPWGWHLTYDFIAENVEMVTTPQHLQNFIDDLVKTIDMVKFGDLWINHFAEHDEDKAGYTIFQGIETSNITAHLCDKSKKVFLDVFSCKPFSPDDVHDVVKKFFNPTIGKMNFFERDIDI